MTEFGREVYGRCCSNTSRVSAPFYKGVSGNYGRCFFDIHVFLPSGLLPPGVFGAAEGLGKAVEGFALGNGDGVVDTAVAGVVVDVLSLALELALFEGHDIDVAVAKERGRLLMEAGAEELFVLALVAVEDVDVDGACDALNLAIGT